MTGAERTTGTRPAPALAGCGPAGGAVRLSASYHRRTGARNELSGAGCQDVVFSGASDGLVFFGLADGQTGKKHCVLGAERNLRALFGLLTERGIDRLSACRYTDEIQYEIIRRIRDTIGQLAGEYGDAPDEFSSTIVAFAVAPGSGRYMTVHLGDGCIVGVRGDGSMNLISAPESGITCRHTWLTTSADALSHVRIGFGTAANYRRIVMLTDGARTICRGRRLSAGAGAVLGGENSREDVLAYVDADTAQDDTSCVVIDIERVR